LTSKQDLMKKSAKDHSHDVYKDRMKPLLIS